MAAGPHGWRNAEAARSGVRPTQRFEATCYGDVFVEGTLIGELGPYDLHNAFDFRGPKPMQVLVLRATLHSPPRDTDDAPLTEADLKTDQTSFHGGDLADELAALVSLALGIRCRSGGTTRYWFGDTNLDGPGQPMASDHRRPYLPSVSRDAQLPFARRRVNVADATDLLKRYLEVTPKAATALARSARLYEQAVWIADDDPSQAWLWLVSALEVAAQQWQRESGKPSDLLRRNWPELSEIVSRHGDEFHDEVAAVAAPLFKVQQRFVSFVTEFEPPPPGNRPYEWAQVDWTQMEQHLRTIYRYRSNALHDGVPFPVPMCAPPQTFDGRPIERPIGLSTKALDSQWAAADVPMLLWVFEHIVRQTLLAWWAQLPTGANKPATGRADPR